jgi:hypothetical protein
MKLRAPILSLLLLALAPAARADLITGQVVGPTGLGVANVNIDAQNNGSGGDPDLVNDGTNAGGFFSTTVTPGGTYDFIFVPPSGSGLVTLVLHDVTVFGTVNLGQLTLAAGATISGQVKSTLGQPLNAIDFDVVNPATGEMLVTPNDMSNALGNFAFTVPMGTWDLTLQSTSETGAQMAPKLLPITVSGNQNLGVVTMQPGFTLSGTLLKPNFAGAAGADLDVIDAAGTELYTPGDNAGTSGFVDVIVPAGTYSIEICPLLTDKLVSKVLTGVTVAGSTSFGTVQLQAGQILSGTVKNGLNQPLANVDTDARFTASGVEIPLCNDNTNAQGVYQVVVPNNSTIDVVFTPSYAVPYGSQFIAGVIITTVNKVQNGVLPDCPFHVAYGSGLAGLGGFVPLLGSSGGAPRFGNPDWALQLSQGRGGALAFLVVGFAPAALPFKGGTLLVDVFSLPSLLLNVPLAGPPNVPGAGAFTLPAPVPTNPSFAGFTWYSQVVVKDAAAPEGYAMSNGMFVTWCP